MYYYTSVVSGTDSHLHQSSRNLTDKLIKLRNHQPQTGSARLPLSTVISKPTLSGCYEDLLLIKATIELLIAWLKYMLFSDHPGQIAPGPRAGTYRRGFNRSNPKGSGFFREKEQCPVRHLTFKSTLTSQVTTLY
jgi:hypothetical protein